MKSRKETLLNWLEREKVKDQMTLDLEKELFAKNIKKMSKNDFFPKPKKLTLWQKIKIMILGN